MPRSRRTFLATTAALAGLAGCVTDSAEQTDDPTPAGTTGESDGSLDLGFGEGATFTNEDDVALSVTVSKPRLRATVPVVRDGEIYVDSPESSEYFFFANVALTNEGASSIDPPSGLFFRTDGSEAERAAIRTPGRKYRDIGELAPGATETGTIAFPAPADADTATVALRFQTLLESPPARWTAAYDDLDRRNADLSRDGFDDPISVETGSHAYEFTPSSARTTPSYEGDDGEEHTAPDGSTFVLLTVRAENVGDEPVKLPTPYDVRLEADGTVVRADQFQRADERYPGRVDPSPPGDAISGVLQYEVPASASSFTVRLAVGNQTFATWPIDPAQS